MNNSAFTSANFSQQDMVDSLQAIQTLSGKLTFVISMTAAQRRKCLKLGDKTIGFADKTLNYASSNSDLVPSYLDMNQYNKVYQLSKNLHELLRELKPLVQDIEDTAMQAGVETLSSSMVFYTAVKVASKQGVPAAKAIYEDLQKRFPGAGSVPKPPASEQ